MAPGSVTPGAVVVPGAPGTGGSMGAGVPGATGAVTPMPLSGSNVLRFELTDGSHIVVRPSGTEPKIKVYILTKGADAAERDANLEKYSAWVKTLA